MGALNCVNSNVNERDQFDVGLETLVLEAKKVAAKHNVNFVATEHLLLSMLSHKNQFKSCISKYSNSTNQIGDLRKVLEDLMKLDGTHINLNQRRVEYECNYTHPKLELVQESLIKDHAMMSPCLSKTLDIIQSFKENEADTFSSIILAMLTTHCEYPNSAGISLTHTFLDFQDAARTISSNIVKQNSLGAINEKQSHELGAFPAFTWSKKISAHEQAILHNKRNVQQLPLKIVEEWPKSPVPDDAHWVIPGRLMIGVSPGIRKISNLMDIVNSGIDTFLCLQIRYTEYSSTDYRKTLENIATRSNGTFPPHDLHFLHFPISDHGTPMDDSMWKLMEEISNVLEIQKRNVYIHCYGGHGRSGLVLVNLLQYLFGISPSSAMKLLKESHKRRNCNFFCSFSSGNLEDSSQTKQVIRLQSIMSKRQNNIRKLQQLASQTA